MKKLTGIMLILILMGTFGCNKQNTEEDVAEDTEVEQTDIEVLREINKNQDATIEDCVAIMDEELQKSCEQDILYNEAIETQNPDKCKDLENETDQESCMVDAGSVEE